MRYMLSVLLHVYVAISKHVPMLLFVVYVALFRKFDVGSDSIGGASRREPQQETVYMCIYFCV